ncbi:hypothetical protein FOZ63_017589, partial [Perkinsus olseni]
EKQVEASMHNVDRTSGASSMMTRLVNMARGVGTSGEKLGVEAQGDLSGLVDTEAREYEEVEDALVDDTNGFKSELKLDKAHSDEDLLAHKTEVARGDSAITGRLGEGSLALGDQASRTGNVLGYNAQAARRYQEAVESEEHITGDEL